MIATKTTSEIWYEKWTDESGLIILFPTGWESPRSLAWEEDISYGEFLERIKDSEIGVYIDD